MNQRFAEFVQGGILLTVEALVGGRLFEDIRDADAFGMGAFPSNVSRWSNLRRRLGSTIYGRSSKKVQTGKCEARPCWPRHGTGKWSCMTPPQPKNFSNKSSHNTPVLRWAGAGQLSWAISRRTIFLICGTRTWSKNP
jgi:hypothetical protein